MFLVLHGYIIYIILNKNNPAEALPAHENDENEYFVTARSVFFHWKPLQKKGPSTLWITTLPWLQPEKGQPQLFLKFSSTCQRWFPSGFLPVHSHRHWKERMHFHIWGLRAWPFFEGKLPGMASLRIFQNPSTWPVWILTFPLFWKCQWRS